MRYKELKINVTRDMFEPAQAVLLENGFSAMQIDDPLDAADIAEHPDLYKYDYINEEILQEAAIASGISEGAPGNITITLYFEDDEEGAAELARAEKLLGEIQGARAPGESERSLKDGGSTDRPGISWDVSATGDDSEWLYKWQEYFKPARIGERIVVKPSWEDYEAGPDDLVIEMDPGMAFGSGLHATTSMCIKALEEVFSDRGRYLAADADTARVLDVGTGTGILAMAAVLLGASDALGIDIDDEAVRVSGENIEKNGLGDKIRIEQGNLMDGTAYEADIITANLMADLVMMLSPAAANRLKPGGIYITSGILDIKEESVKDAIKAAGFDIIKVLADGEWRAVMAEKGQ